MQQVRPASRVSSAPKAVTSSAACGRSPREFRSATTFWAAPSFRTNPTSRPAIAFVVPKESVTVVARLGRRCGYGHAGQRLQQRATDESVRTRPPHHSFTDCQALDRNAAGWNPGTRLHREGLFLGLIFSWFSCEFGAIFTGTARAACEEYERQLRTKPSFADPTRPRMHDPELQRVFGEAICRADAAEGLTFAATRLYTEQCDRWMKTRTPITPEDTTKVWGTAREGCRAACEAVEMLFHTVGASVARRGEQVAALFPGRADVSDPYSVPGAHASRQGTRAARTSHPYPIPTIVVSRAANVKTTSYR